MSGVEPQPSFFNFQDCFQFALKWTPRAIVAGLAGYYCLGIAYEMGIMAAIDRLAISILRPSMGYIGIGAFMPTFQWYSAWGVRMTAAIGAGLLYDLVERIIRVNCARCFCQTTEEEEEVLIPAPTYRCPSPARQLHPAPIQRFEYYRY